MDSRERLIRVLEGKDVDRRAVAPFIFNNLVNEYYGSAAADNVAGCIQIYKEYGFDIILRNYIGNAYRDERLLDCDNWRVKTEISGDKEGDRTERTVIQTPERRLVQEKTYRKVTGNETVEAVTEFFIKDQDDFRQFVKFRPPFPGYDFSTVKHARELVGSDGLTGPWIDGVFNTTASYRRVDDLMMDPYTDEGFYREMMEYFRERVQDYMENAIRAGADFISMSGNIASGSMAGPDFFEEFVMPYENKVIDAVHACGGYVIYHNCGDAMSLYEKYADMPFDVLETLTEPPYGDTDLEKALRIIPERMVLSGNIDQIDMLVNGTKEEVYNNVKKLMERVGGRKSFIIATGDYILEGTPRENLRAVYDAVCGA